VKPFAIDLQKTPLSSIETIDRRAADPPLLGKITTQRKAKGISDGFPHLTSFLMWKMM
jgi:hypothetical protein